MTITEKIFLFSLLFSIGGEYVRSTRKYRRQFDAFNPMSVSPNYNPSGNGQGQGQVQVQAMNGFAQSPQPMWNQWAPQSTTPSPAQPMWNQWSGRTSTPLTTTTTPNRFLPHSPRKTHTTTDPPFTHSVTTNRPRKKYGRITQDSADGTMDKTRELIAQRDKTIAHISAKLQPYFLRAVVNDFAMRLTNTTKTAKVLLDSNELTALQNPCSMCSVQELQTVLNIFLTIMEKYPELNADTSLSAHVATEYERAADYLGRKLEQLRTEISAARYDTDFRDIQRRYARRERNGGIMSLLLEWYESFARNGRDDEQDIQQKLIKHLTTQKRYWLISIKGVL